MSLSIDPTLDLPAGTTCDVTVLKSKVSDLDTLDGFDNLLADYAFSFTTLSPPPADDTPPTVTPDILGTLGDNGWYTSDVTVSWIVTDPDSAIISTACAPTSLSTESASTAVSCSATSTGGTTSNSVTIKLDKTGPSAELAVTAGTPGSNGWYTSNVTVGTSGTDDISGPVTCTDDQFQGAETQGNEFHGSCTNDAGLSTDAAPVTVKLDKTGPTASLAVTAGTPGSNGWYTSDVTVSTSGTDSISGPVTCTAPDSLTTDNAGTTFEGGCINDAGITTLATPLTVKLDETAPGVTWTGGPAAGGSYYFGSVPAAGTCDATDEMSGPDDCAVTGYGTTVGPHTLIATAQDNAGNSGSENRTYSVNAWTLKGFYQPVDMGGSLNIVKAGSTVPLKFEVFAGPTELTDVAVVDTFKWGEVPCTDFSGVVMDDIEQYTSGQTVLRYDSTGGQFIQNWQTPKRAGTCFKVTMKTDDGTPVSANFKLK